MPKIALKQRLREGEIVVGPLLVELASPGLAVTFADVGFDFLLFDLEHAPLDESTVAHTMLAARQAGVPSIIKIPALERSAVQRYLDYGGSGIQIPHVESAEELQQLLEWGRYPPVGTRSQVFGLGNTGFRTGDFNDYVSRANDETLLIPMIETRRGVEGIEAILANGGVDLLFLGTGDLSSSYGVPGQLTHPLVLEAARGVIAACKKRDVIVGVYAQDAEAAGQWIGQGVRLIACSSELDMIRHRATTLLAALKDVRKA
jgi:2-keto-3-deoxy-L-rhamnonate aldolase RhmA